MGWVWRTPYVKWKTHHVSDDSVADIEAGVLILPGGQWQLLPDWKLVGCGMWQYDGYPTDFHGHCEKRGQKFNVP